MAHRAGRVLHQKRVQIGPLGCNVSNVQSLHFVYEHIARPVLFCSNHAMNLGSQSLILFVPSMSLSGMTNLLVRFQIEGNLSE